MNDTSFWTPTYHKIYFFPLAINFSVTHLDIAFVANSKLKQGQLSLLQVFKALALCADAFYKSKCPSVCVGVSVFTF